MQIALITGYPHFLAGATMGYGYVAEAQGRLRHSSILLSAGEKYLDSIGMTEMAYPNFGALYQRFMTIARNQLGEAEFDQDRAGGSAITLEKAVK